MPRKPGDAVRAVNKDLEDAHRKFRDRRRLEMFRALSIIEAQTKANIRKNFTIRTGTLLNSVKKKVVEDDNELIGLIEVDAPYAAMLEFGSAGDEDVPASKRLPGGVITPKRSKYLAIPFPGTTGPDGIARLKPRELIDPVFIPSRKGGFVMGTKTPGGNFIPQFILKESVKIEARPYLRPAFEASEKRIEERFEMFLKRTFTFR